MIWQQQHGAQYRRYEALAADGDQAAARILAKRPKISQVLLPFYQAFHDLQPEAPEYSGTVTWRSVANYAKDLGFSIDYMELMFDVLRVAQNTMEDLKTST